MTTVDETLATGEGKMQKMVTFGSVALLIAATAQAQSALSTQDYIEIHELFARYAYAMDSSNPSGLRDVFTEDGVFTIDGVNTWNGRAEIESLLTAPTRERPKITHFFANTIVKPTAEGATASHYVALINLQQNDAVTGGGFCDHTLVKMKDGWRMKTRVCFVEPGPTETAK